MGAMAAPCCRRCSIATARMTSSIISVTNWAMITEKTRCSFGNCTFLIRPAPPCTAPIATPTEIVKKLNGSEPQRK